MRFFQKLMQALGFSVRVKSTLSAHIAHTSICLSPALPLPLHHIPSAVPPLRAEIASSKQRFAFVLPLFFRRGRNLLGGGGVAAADELAGWSWPAGEATGRLAASCADNCLVARGFACCACLPGAASCWSRAAAFFLPCCACNLFSF